MSQLNPHGVKLEFGKHKGKLLTRVPASYLKFMVNDGTPQAGFAAVEIKRRGHALPEVELSPHAINNASLRVLKIWKQDRTEHEGMWSWLERVTLEAIQSGTVLDSGKTLHKGMKFVIKQGEEFPVLKTIMRAGK